MAMIAFVIAIAGLLFRVSANNYTTTMLIPNGMFDPYPSLQTFVGKSTVSNTITYYTVNCGPDDTNFWPGPYGCDASNSYTFSASSDLFNQEDTQWTLPK